MNAKNFNSSPLVVESIRIVHVSKLNYCLQSTNKSMSGGGLKVANSKRGPKTEQVWVLSTTALGSVIEDYQNRKLSANSNGKVSTIDKYPENEKMNVWNIERCYLVGEENCFDGTYRIKNMYFQEYLTLYSNGELGLEPPITEGESQEWCVFKSKESFIPETNINYFIRNSISGQDIYLKRIADNFTEASNGNLQLNSFKWAFSHNHLAESNFIKNNNAKLIPDKAYAKLYTKSKYYDEQNWFINKLPNGKFVIINAASGKVLESSEPGDKVFVRDFVHRDLNVNTKQSWDIIRS